MSFRGCEICKRPLEPQRLEHPTTRLCNEHHEAIQKYGGEFVRATHTENLGKAGSLKKNFGGVSVRMQRNEAAIARLREDYERGKQQ
jgi:hypothetical protein